MIVPLLQRIVPGRAEVANEVRGHYLGLLDRLGVARKSPSDPPKAIGVTSCRSGEGVSTVAASLAVTAASSGHGPVLLIDANLERPAVHRLLAVKPAPGLAEAVADRSPASVLQPSTVPGLVVLSAGAADKCSSQAVTSSSFADLLERLKDEFPFIMVDMAAVDRGGMAVQLAAGLDGVLLVVEAERVRGEEVRQRKDMLARARANLLGVVFNKQRQYLPARLDRWI